MLDETISTPLEQSLMPLTRDVDYSEFEVHPGPDTLSMQVRVSYDAERVSPTEGWVLVDDDENRVHMGDSLADWLRRNMPRNGGDAYRLDLAWEVQMTARPRETSTDRGVMRWTDMEPEIIGLVVKVGDKTIHGRDGDMATFEELLPQDWEQRLLQGG